jgi:SNF2 family DNA or RNA helicase
MTKSINQTLTFAERMILISSLTKSRMAAIDLRVLFKDKSYLKFERFSKIEELILQLSKENKSVVVFSEWIYCLELLEEFLIENKIEFAFFHSKIDLKKRQQNLKDFINGKIKILLSTDSGGLGVDGLQRVSHNIIHIEKTWNCMKLEQRNGRLVRALQKEPIVNIHYFEAIAQIENLLLNGEIRKKEVAGYFK